MAAPTWADGWRLKAFRRKVTLAEKCDLPDFNRAIKGIFPFAGYIKREGKLALNSTVIWSIRRREFFAVDLINFTSSSSSSLSPQMLRRFVNFGEIYRPVFLPLVESPLYRILNEQTFSLHRLDGVSKEKFQQKIAERRQNFADSEMSGNEEKLRSPKVWCFADQQQWGFNEPRALFRFALSASWSA